MTGNTVDWNEAAVASAVRCLMAASEILVRATQDTGRQAYVDKKFDDINRAMTALQLVLTSSHFRYHKPIMKVVK